MDREDPDADIRSVALHNRQTLSYPVYSRIIECSSSLPFIIDNFDGDQDVSSYIFCKIESLMVENAGLAENDESGKQTTKCNRLNCDDLILNF